ncbi:MAG TPA: hypothetical protein V6D47_03445, partial [Oscillatoriaceae cyanobacterium]
LDGQTLEFGELPDSRPNWSTLLAECGRDAVRAALIAAPGQPVRFAPPRETLEEPLFFLQYALARARRLAAFEFPDGDAPMPEAARALRVALALYADRLAAAGTARAPWRLWTILTEIAQAFYAFVRRCPPGDTPWTGYGHLISASESVLSNGLEALMFLSIPADV